MAKLPSDIPSWVGQYVGLEFHEHGRTRDEGLDCWGLYRLVQAERFGVYLDSFADRYQLEERRTVAEAITQSLAADWQRVDEADRRVGDAAVFTLNGKPWHIGMVIARGRMLHAHRDVKSCIERLDTPSWCSRLDGVYRFAGPVRMVGRPKPFRLDRVDVAMPCGMTIAEMLTAAQLTEWSMLHVRVGEVLVPREQWERVRPKAGRLVTVSAAPLGGGGNGSKNPLQSVLTIAVLAASIAAPYALAAAGVGGLFTSAGALTLRGALLAAGVGIAGTLAVSALIPPPRPVLSDAGIGDGGNASASLGITGGRNDSRPYGVVPVVLGDLRITPPQAAKPFTEIVGDDQYLRMLFVLGYGPLEVSDIRIGETSIDEYEGVEYELRSGVAGEAPITLYPQVIDETPYNVLVESGAGWIVRTTDPDTAEISVDLTFPQGLVRIADDGKKSNASVALEIQYAPAGSNAWQGVNSVSPVTERGMDLLFRTPEVVFGGSGVHAGEIAWGSVYGGTKPAYLPADGFSWEATGWLYAPTTGQYVFAVDGSDACDISIDGAKVIDYYGQHDAAGDLQNAYNFLQLTAGWHMFRARVESRSGNGGSLACGWIKPGDPPAFSIIPASSFSRSAGGTTGQLSYRWFRTEIYGAAQLNVTEARADMIRRNQSFAVPPGQYDVRIRRITPDTNDQRILDKVYLTAIRSVKAQDPVKLAGVARLAVRIKATNQLNGVVDTLNCRVRSILPDWDAASGTWITRATSNPASHYRALLQGPANKRPLTDDRVDLAALEEWHEYCDDQAFQCNAAIDFAGTLFERLRDVAATGRATFGMRDGKYSVVRDVRQSVPVQHFTPRNSRDFRGSKVFADIPHALRVQFLDRDNNFERGERIVLNDGYQIDGKDAFGNAAPALPPATEYETLEMFGVTSAEEAWKHGRYHLAVARLRPESYEISTDIEHLVCNRGDLVLVTHDVPLFGLGFGRVVRTIVDTDNNQLGLVLDSKVTMEAGKTYSIRVRLEDGTSFIRFLQTEEGEQTKVRFVGPVAPAERRPAADNLFMFGEMGLESRELIVKSIEIDPDLGARISLVDHAPAVHDADVGEIPPYVPGTSFQPEYLDRPDPPVIEQIRSDDFVIIRNNQDGSLVHRMVISLRRPSSSKPLPVEAQVRLRPKPAPPATPLGPWVTYTKLPIDDNQVSILGVESGVTYAIQIRVISAKGVASVWVEAEHTVIGKIIPPPNVQAFDVKRLSDGTRSYSWVLGTVPPDIAGVKIRYGDSNTPQNWDLLEDLHDGLLEGASPAELNVPPQGDWIFAIKMVDTAGAESEQALFVTKSLGAPRQPEVAISRDARALGWPGIKTDCSVSAEDFLVADDRATWDTLASVYNVSTWDAFWRWQLDPKNPIVYEHPVIDIGVVLDFEPQATAKVDGTALIEVAWSSDGTTYLDWTDIKTLAGSTVRARYIKFRVTVTQTPGQIAVIRDFVMLPRAETVEENLQDVNTALLGPANRLAAGDVILPVSRGVFAIIKHVGVTFNGAGAGWTWEVVNKFGDPGPRVRLYNPSGVLADATIDATIRGLKSIDGSTAELPAGRMRFNARANTVLVAVL